MFIIIQYASDICMKSRSSGTSRPQAHLNFGPKLGLGKVQAQAGQNRAQAGVCKPSPSRNITRSVHRSEEFRGWMRTNHPNIILDFVPGGCTGIHQPCDVGIQRPLKLSIRKSYHEDIVAEFVSQLNNGCTVLKIDDSIGVLRDRSVNWMWNAFSVLQNKELIKKVCSSLSNIMNAFIKSPLYPGF